MKGSIVLGLNFGDEGKGLTTSFLCSKVENPIVVRFNGGHQAGHTVVIDDKRHVFSNMGAGTLQGVPTYWSQFCTFHPVGFVREYIELKTKKGISPPQIFVNPLCPVTTPYDIAWNQIREKKVGHGSVGVGFGATIERQENYFKLHVLDLFSPTILMAKIGNIKSYYERKFRDSFGYGESFPNLDTEMEEFLLSLEFIKELQLFQVSDDTCLEGRYPVFEGAQGILLDMDFGFFPNVTRSNTTSKNALSIVDCDEIYYVTRSYLTRHGAGFLPGEKEMVILNNEMETNVQHEYQGKFRTAELNTELINYALECDNNFSKGKKKNLVITCTDQYPIIIEEFLSKIKTKFDNVYYSSGDSLSKIYKY